MSLDIKIAIIIVLNFIISYVLAQTTAKFDVKKHSLQFKYDIAQEISKEIAGMNLPDVEITHRKKPKNVSLATMKHQIRTFALGTLENIQFKLYRRSNADNPVYLLPNPHNLTACNFDPLKKVVMFIHGWVTNSLYPSCLDIMNSYLQMEDCNVIIVDWGNIANNVYYPCVTAQSKNVGWYIGEFVNTLLNFGCSSNLIHLIGHSIGPHIAGFAAENCVEKIGRITALDPAMPGFMLNTLAKFGGAGRLMPYHAEFVDVIHTNGGTLGMIAPCGHVDFYPNDGQVQPGCWIVNFICSHNRVYDLWDESIGRSIFPAKPCPDETSASHDKILMGQPTPRTARGRYCLVTNSQSPYGIPIASPQRHQKRTHVRLPINKGTTTGSTEPPAAILPMFRRAQSGKAKDFGVTVKVLCVLESLVVINLCFGKNLSIL